VTGFWEIEAVEPPENSFIAFLKFYEQKHNIFIQYAISKIQQVF
jgi:hypothetical protein